MSTSVTLMMYIRINPFRCSNGGGLHWRKMLSESRAYPLALCGLAEGAADKRQKYVHLQLTFKQRQCELKIYRVSTNSY